MITYKQFLYERQKMKPKKITILSRRFKSDIKIQKLKQGCE